MGHHADLPHEFARVRIMHRQYTICSLHVCVYVKVCSLSECSL